MDSHWKEQLHDSVVSMMQSQHFPMGRSGGFNLGVTFSSRLQQQQQHASSIGSGGLPSIGLRPMNSSNTISGVRPYDQLIPPPLNNTVSKLQAWFQWNALWRRCHHGSLYHPFIRKPICVTILGFISKPLQTYIMPLLLALLHARTESFSFTLYHPHVISRTHSLSKTLHFKEF